MKPAPIRATTQEHLDVANITKNVALLKDGSVAMILQISAVNFDLLSEEEQESTIFAYAALLNSLTFPIQILVTSKRKDISSYLEQLKVQEDRAKAVAKDQIRSYRQFISKIVKEGNVLDKKFYLIIPYSRLELGLKATNPIQIKKPTTLPFEENYILSKALITLGTKRDHLVRQFARIGLSVKQLNTQEITQMLYNMYNPDIAGGIKLASSNQYNTSLVQPAKQFQEATVMTDTNSAPGVDTNPTPTTPSSPPTPTPINPTPTPPTPPTTPTTPPPTTPAPDPTPTPPTPTPTPPSEAPTPPPTPTPDPAQSTINDAASQVVVPPTSPETTPTAQ